jgi:hypothetical protein
MRKYDVHQIYFVFPTSLIQILSFLFDSTYTVLHYGSSFAHAQTANPNFEEKNKDQKLFIKQTEGEHKVVYLNS